MKQDKTSKKSFSKRRLMLWLAALMMVFTALGAVFVNAVTDTTRPTIISVTPANNEVNISTQDVITVQFSEPMNASSINNDTFIVMVRTTPMVGSNSSEYRSKQVMGVILYKDMTASFMPVNFGANPLNSSQEVYIANPLQPSQQFGNVFSVTLKDGITDLAGNSLSRDYVWSFTTGMYAFYNDNTTSQKDQSAIPVIAPIVPETPQPPAQAVVPVTPVQTTVVNDMSWIWWAVAGAFLLLIIALLAVRLSNTTPARRSTSESIRTESIRTTQKTNRAVRSSPFGSVHPVMDIEGIGTEYSKKLHTMGIKNTKQLWVADASKIARATGASMGTVRGWQQMAELSSVKDIGPQYAELLERSGVHSIDQLKNYDTDKLLKMINQKQDSLKVNIQGNSPGHATVEHWIDEARDHTFTDIEDGQTA